MSVLIIAFDGADKELIEDCGLDNIRQEEFGAIDNNTDIFRRKTSELFASFVTGVTYREHGVTSLKKWNNSRIQLIESFFDRLPFSNKWQGVRTALFESINKLDANKVAYNRHDYDCLTFFDKVDNSKASDVPGYNPSPYWSKLGTGGQLREHDTGNEDREIYWDDHEYSRRQKNLFRPVNNYFDLFMAHFHRIDVHQHFYGTPEIYLQEEKLNDLYVETDNLAGEIIQHFQDEFETIIFMSDHGLPTGDQHNENAFYSCNHELFGDETPHITDFHDKVLELVEDE